MSIFNQDPSRHLHATSWCVKRPGSNVPVALEPYTTLDMVETKFPKLRTSVPASEGNLWEPELLNESYKESGPRSLWVDYCMNSTIHGFKYLVGNKRTTIER